MSSIDIGANLCHDSFDADREAVLQRARQAGVEAILVTGSCGESVPAAIELARAYPGYLYATAGVHPHHAAEVDASLLDRLRHWASSDVVVAMGEMGLDFFRNISPPEAQERAFHAQLQLAAEIGKPLFLHQRDAHERFLPILKAHLTTAAVVHCFTGTQAELHAYLDMDLYIGITGWICDERRGAHLLEFVADIPAERLLVETDAPYLLPRSLKPRPSGRRNEPMYLNAVIDMIAEATGTAPASLAQQTAANARRLFALGDAD